MHKLYTFRPTYLYHDCSIHCNNICNEEHKELIANAIEEANDYIRDFKSKVIAITGDSNEFTICVDE